jgi:hypothetical protein
MKKMAMFALRAKDLAEAAELHEIADLFAWAIGKLGFTEVGLESEAL